jgi:hypothetical protein
MWWYLPVLIFLKGFLSSDCKMVIVLHFNHRKLTNSLERSFSPFIKPVQSIIMKCNCATSNCFALTLQQAVPQIFNCHNSKPISFWICNTWPCWLAITGNNFMLGCQL